MSNRACPNCGTPFRTGDKVKAVVIAEWQELKSNVAYAISRPTECLEVTHKDCRYPKEGEISGD